MAHRGGRGFTLLEVALALAILAGVILVLATTTSRFIHTATLDQQRTQADAAADAHLARIRLFPLYDSLAARFAGAVTDTPFPGWTRITTVTRIGGPGQPNDYTRVTVGIVTPNLPDTVRRSITVASVP